METLRNEKRNMWKYVVSSRISTKMAERYKKFDEIDAMSLAWHGVHHTSKMSKNRLLSPMKPPHTTPAKDLSEEDQVNYHLLYPKYYIYFKRLSKSKNQIPQTIPPNRETKTIIQRHPTYLPKRQILRQFIQEPIMTHPQTPKRDFLNYNFRYMDLRENHLRNPPYQSFRSKPSQFLKVQTSKYPTYIFTMLSISQVENNPDKYQNQIPNQYPNVSRSYRFPQPYLSDIPIDIKEDTEDTPRNHPTRKY